MKKRILALALGLAVVCSSITGCEKDTPSKDETVEENISDNNIVYGQVKTINGSTITLTLDDMGGPPSMSDNGTGGPPLTSDNDTDRPPSISGNDMKGPPSMSDNNIGDPPAPSENAGGPQPMDKARGEERDITVTDDTVYTIEDGQESKKGSLKDITEKCMLQVILKDDRTTASSITIQQGMPGPGDGDEAKDVGLSGAKTIEGKKVSSSDGSFDSSSADENTVLVTDGGNLHMVGAVLTKSGDTTNADNSNFYGTNAVLAVEKASTAELTNVDITSTGEGSNAIFATGEGSSISVDNVKIHTKGDSARGLDATYGGRIDASAVEITTEGAHCAALATDRGEGTVTVNGAVLSTAGDGSPCIYSTGEISVQNTTGTASGSQTLVVEGKNSIDLTECELSGAGPNGLMLYQSTSGDAQEGTAIFHATDSKLTTTSSGPMIYVTNTDAEVTLDNTTLSFPGDTLIQAAGNETNNWGVPGQNGGTLTLTGIRQRLKGNVICDGISTVSLHLSEGSQFTGAIDTEHAGKETSLQLDDSSTWNVTADSHLTSLTNSQDTCSNIQSNGHTVYYDPTHTDNKWLDGQTLDLPGGGKLTPDA